MKTQLLACDPKEPLARLRLQSGEKVSLGGGMLAEYTFSCHALVNNWLGFPIKRIWKFAFSDSPSDRNIVHLDFGKYGCFDVLVGYAAGFQSVDAMRQAQGRHAELFDPDAAMRALEALCAGRGDE